MNAATTRLRAVPEPPVDDGKISVRLVVYTDTTHKRVSRSLALWRVTREHLDEMNKRLAEDTAAHAGLPMEWLPTGADRE